MMKRLLNDFLHQKFKLPLIFQKLIDEDVIMLIGLVSLLPFVVASFYNHLSMDDFCYAVRARQLGIWDAVMTWYVKWSGRYFASFLLSLDLLDMNDKWPVRMIPVALIVSLAASFHWLAGNVFPDVRLKDRFILTCAFMTLYLYQMPSVSEGFYWMAGSLTYQVPNVLALLFLACSVRLMKSDGWLDAVAMIIMAFMIIGSNETSMLLIDFTVFIFWIFCYVREGRVDRRLSVVLFFMVLFSLLVYLAPGNKIRESYFENRHDPLRALSLTVLGAGYFFMKWISFLLVMIMFMARRLSGSDFSSNFRKWCVHPVISFGFLLSLVLLGFFPAAWSQGGVPPGRTVDVIYLAYLLGALYFFFTLRNYLHQRNFEFVMNSVGFRWILVTLMASGLLNANNIWTAYEDLVRGRISGYDREMTEREGLLLTAGKDTCYVANLSVKPKTIFFNDMTNNPGDWSNQCLAEYLGIKAVIIKER